MSDRRLTCLVKISNAQGLHARPAELFSRLAMGFVSKIEVEKSGVRIDAKSILDVLTLAAQQGTELTLHAEGPDAQAALDALAALVNNGFSVDPNTDKNTGESP
jgi:phosphotransferase system HPr (HPr) family protein